MVEANCVWTSFWDDAVTDDLCLLLASIAWDFFENIDYNFACFGGDCTMVRFLSAPRSATGDFLLAGKIHIGRTATIHSLVKQSTFWDASHV